MKQTHQQSQDFLNYCLSHKRLSPDSIRGYRYDLRYFNEFIDNRSTLIDDYNFITPSILDEYVTALKKYSAKTIRRKLSGVRSLFSYLEYKELVRNNPFHKFKLNIRDPYKIRTCLTVEEINQLLTIAYEDKPYPVLSFPHGEIRPYSVDFLWVRNIAILELLFAGGMRVSELCSIKYEDVNFEEMSILIHGKGNKERVIYIEHAEVFCALKEYLVYRQLVRITSDYIFITKDYIPLTPQAVTNVIRKYSNQAKICKHVTPHVIRHTFASLLLEEGVDIKYIQDFLGHSSISTTQLYLHTTKNQKKKIIATKHPRGQMNLRDSSMKMSNYLSVGGSDLKDKK